MSLVTIGIIALIIMFAMLAFGMPIGVGMGIIGALGMWYVISGSAAFAKLAIPPFDTVASYELAVVPLFLLMAHIVFTTGMGKDLYSLAAKWLGHLPGGVAIATVAGCGAFAAVSASSMATAATMGLVAMPEMKKLKYDPALSTGCVAAGGSIGILIPPSTLLIIYGIITQTSIAQLFIAGFVPGVLEALFYMITIYILCARNPSLGPRSIRYKLKDKIIAIGGSAELIVLILVVIVGLTSGWFTPTEAGAIGALGSILLAMIRKRLTWRKLKDSFTETMKTTGMIYGIIIGAFILNYFLTVTRIPYNLSEFVAHLPLPPLGVLGIIMLMYLLLGCVLDGAAMMLLTIPIFFPLAMKMGFNPIWFGILVCRAIEIAMITPPIGINVYVIAGVAPDVPMQTIFKGIFPFFISDIVHVLMLIFIPSVVMFLPNLLF